jgi:hypothetical protein
VKIPCLLKTIPNNGIPVGAGYDVLLNVWILK